MGSGIFCKFGASHHVAADSLNFGAILVFPMARVRLLLLQKQGATPVLPSRACCLANWSPDLENKGSCPRIIYS